MAWHEWVECKGYTSITSTDATASGTDYVWGNWVDSTSTSSTTSTISNVWLVWCEDSGGTTTATASDAYAPFVREVSRIDRLNEAKRDRNRVREAEIKRQLEIERLERERKAEELRLQKEAAELTAQALLEDLIGEDQMRVYKKTGRLFVSGKKFDYLIKKGGGVAKIEKNTVRDLCIHLDRRHSFPESDNVAALALGFKVEEDKMLQLANDHGSLGRPDDYKRQEAANY